MTDTSDTTIGVHDYFAFGTEIPSGTTEPAPTALKYTGHERDTWLVGSDYTLDYMHARYYNAASSRFLSIDPTWESVALSRPQSWNRIPTSKTTRSTRSIRTGAAVPL